MANIKTKLFFEPIMSSAFVKIQIEERNVISVHNKHLNAELMKKILPQQLIKNNNVGKK